MRQTTAPVSKDLMFPDGFRLEVSSDGSEYTDLGVVDGGATITFNWDERKLDGGNYVALLDEYVNPTIALAPSNLMEFKPENILAVFGGFMTSEEATEPTGGTALTHVGATRHGTLSRVFVRLTHYTVDASGGDEADTDIDWQFTLSNTKLDAGAAFNITGAESQDLSNVSVSFTSEPNPTDATDFFKFFHI